MRHIIPLVIAIAPFGCFVASDTDGAPPVAPPTSSPPGSSLPRYPPPAGCRRTACDADAEECRRDAQASCIRCKVDCGAIQIEYQSQCISACARLCSATDKSATSCDNGAQTCRASSPRNGFCVDGLTEGCVPAPSTASKLPETVTGHRGKCTNAEIALFADACLAASATASRCEGFAAGHPSCTSCAIGATGAEPLWSPEQGASTWTNDGLCVAIHGHTDCGRKIFAADSCAAKACAACDGQTAACGKAAYALSCAELTSAKDACVAKLPVEVRSDCVIPIDGVDFATVAQRMIAQVCGI